MLTRYHIKDTFANEPRIKIMPLSIILIARIPGKKQPKGTPDEVHVFQKAISDYNESPFYKEGIEPGVPETGEQVKDFKLDDVYSVSFAVEKASLEGSCVIVEMKNLLFKRNDRLTPELNSKAQFTIFTESGWRCPEFTE